MGLNSTETFKLLLDKIDDAVLVSDTKGELIYFNKSAQLVFGFKEGLKKLEWLEYFELFNKDSKTKIERNNFPLLKFLKKEKILNTEYFLYPKSRPAIKISISLSPIDEDDFTGALMIIKNISSRDKIETRLIERSKSLTSAYENLRRAEASLKVTNTELEKRVLERTSKLSKINQELKKEIFTRTNTEVQLKEKNKQLLKINTDLDNFIYTASHDLRAPIANLEGLILALNDALKNNNKTEVGLLLNHVEKTIEKFKQTISDLTEISKVQKGIDEEIEEIAFSHVLHDTIFSIDDLLKSSKASIVKDFKIEKIHFSAKNLRSIFLNLLSNAIKYRSPERKLLIKISSKKLNGHTILTFADNGLGISKDQQGKIFQMFRRAHDHVEGSGIGLYIVKRIIENCDGKIEVDSDLKKGTTFTIYFKNAHTESNQN